ncbi:MAG: NADH-quinone oxidoreductase subunit A [Acidobacteria bacterium 13_1_20CM_4_56_7]|nr:MAG: NADH-quinone oxidoreductase subunit A [Acidobacteria bacterium 13_1_20CM_4_56_7]PYV51799.1 MAG: NADH-quinone oxidoreductase subunit A [Acidobacteriota bacterium]
MPDNYFARYLPLLIHFILAGALASALVTLSWLIGYRRPTRAKMSPYECGMTPIGDARQRFSVKFYMVAMLFILFDVEAVFLYPWAIILKDLKKMGQGLFGLSEMFVYIGIVLVGFWYIWKKGALDWGLTISSPQAARITRVTSGGASSQGREQELVGVGARRSET